MVRHMVLVHAFGGSNPSSRTNKSTKYERNAYTFKNKNQNNRLTNQEISEPIGFTNFIKKDMTKQKDNLTKKNEINKLGVEAVRIGGPLAGNVGGAVIGALLGGPVGAAIGGVAVTVLTEFTSRALGVREKERVNALFLLTAKRVDEKIAQGASVRSDDFFTTKKDGRSSGEEIFEGIVLASQREYEEKKLPYFANLLANIVFSSIEKSDANLLLKMAERLSYRQLCLLAIFAGQQIKSTLRSESYRGKTGEVTLPNTLIAILQEIYELDQLGLINCSGEVLLGLSDVTPAKMNVQGTGSTLGNLMELRSIPAGDLVQIATHLE